MSSASGPAGTHSSQARDIARRIGARFRRRWHRDYASAKLRFDPAYAAVADLLGNSDRGLLDIGCGLGLLGFYLRERGYRGACLGVDFDPTKIAEARHAAQGRDAGLAFEVGDARALPAFSGHVVLLDVLHYLDQADQQALLGEAAARVAPDACLVLRNVLRTRGWRFHATVLEERFLYASRWMRSPARHYPTREEIEAPLLAAGFSVDVQPLWGKTPFNSFFIVARRG
jgi:SAM-dependent methyltransferase